MPRIKANINPQILVWARKNSGYTIEEAAYKINVKTERLRAWEYGEEKPSLNQLIKIGKTFKRPSAIFYSHKIPKSPPPITDFRTLPDTDFELVITPDMSFEIRFAHERRKTAIELKKQLGERIPDFPLTAEMTEKPEALSNRIREILDVTIRDQFSWVDKHKALRSWITAVENTGVLVFQFSGIDIREMRGYSISETPFPVIGLNGKDSPRGRIFTLLHEFTHIVLGNGGICNLLDKKRKYNPVEVYCNRVAGEILVPTDTLLQEQIVINHTNDFWDEWQLRELSKKFKVSQEVILRRLLISGKASEEFYSSKRDELLKMFQQRSTKKKGGPPQFRLILRDNGRYYTSLVLSSYHRDLITSRDLSNFLGGIKLSNIPPIEEILVNERGK